MSIILAMIQVICLMAAQSPDHSNQSRLIRRLLWDCGEEWMEEKTGDRWRHEGSTSVVNNILIWDWSPATQLSSSFLLQGNNTTSSSEQPFTNLLELQIYIWVIVCKMGKTTEHIILVRQISLDVIKSGNGY